MWGTCGLLVRYVGDLWGGFSVCGGPVGCLFGMWGTSGVLVRYVGDHNTNASDTVIVGGRGGAVVAKRGKPGVLFLNDGLERASLGGGSGWSGGGSGGIISRELLEGLIFDEGTVGGGDGGSSGSSGELYQDDDYVVVHPGRGSRRKLPKIPGVSLRPGNGGAAHLIYGGGGGGVIINE